MSNSDEDAAQKQWEARNSDRRDSFEGVKYGLRTGEVRTIEYAYTPLRTPWSVESQWGTNGELSEEPTALRQVHVWPSDVVPPAEGAHVLLAMQQMTDGGELGMNRPEAQNGNGSMTDEQGDVWQLYVYAPAADGD